MEGVGRGTAMSPDGSVASRGGRVGIRLSLSVVPAAGINLLLMWLILRLVDPTLPPPPQVTMYRPVEWVSVEPASEKIPEPSTLMPMDVAGIEPPLPQPDLPTMPDMAFDKAPPPSRPRIDLEFRPLARLTPIPFSASEIPPSSAPPVDAEPSFQVAPVYPTRARRAGIEGSVTVEFTITREGSVTDLEIVASRPRNVFDASVRRAIRQWKFTPRVVDGQRVKRRARKEIVFSLDDR